MISLSDISKCINENVLKSAETEPFDYNIGKCLNLPFKTFNHCENETSILGLNLSDNLKRIFHPYGESCERHNGNIIPIKVKKNYEYYKLSFIYSVFYCVNKNLRKMQKCDRIKFVDKNILKMNKHVNNVNMSFEIFNLNLFRLTADYFKINLMILDIILDRPLFVFPKDTFNKSNNTIIISVFDNVFDPIIFKNEGVFNWENPLLKNMLNNSSDSFLILSMITLSFSEKWNVRKNRESTNVPNNNNSLNSTKSKNLINFDILNKLDDENDENNLNEENGPNDSDDFSYSSDSSDLINLNNSSNSGNSSYNPRDSGESGKDAPKKKSASFNITKDEKNKNVATRNPSGISTLALKKELVNDNGDLDKKNINYLTKLKVAELRIICSDLKISTFKINRESGKKGIKLKKELIDEILKVYDE